MLNLANQLYAFFVGVGVVAAPLVLTCLFLGLIFKKFSNAFGHAVMIGSYIWGAGLWLGCAINVYLAWGLVGFFVGVMMLGVGVVPLSILAKLAKGYPSGALQDFVVLAVVISTRILGAHIAGQKQTLAKAAETF